jgi:hypothetical protein
MAARVIPLRHASETRGWTCDPAPQIRHQSPPSRLHFWRVDRQQHMLASVLGLLECPPLPAAVALLVARRPHGRREVLAVLNLAAEHPTANLAQVRHRCASLGGNEVHVLGAHLDVIARDALARDLARVNGADLVH